MLIFIVIIIIISGLEIREYGRGDPLRWPRDTLYPQKLALTSPTSGGHSVGIVRSRTKATEFVYLLLLLLLLVVVVVMCFAHNVITCIYTVLCL
jgi:hypothetical protein